MKAYSAMTKAELTAEYDKAKAAFEELKGLGLKLNMARGKPEVGQLDLCMGILDVIKTDADCMDPIDGNDARQYGTQFPVFFADLIHAKQMDQKRIHHQDCPIKQYKL